MAKLSAEQRAALEQQLAEDDAASADDEDWEVDWWEETPDGHRRGGRMPWRQAKKLYGHWAPDVFGEPPQGGSGAEGDGQGAPDGGAPAEGGKPAGSYFARRKPAAGQ